MRIHAAACVLLFVGFLAAIAVQTVFRLLPEAELVGVMRQIDKPALSLQSWWDGQYQKAMQGTEQAEGWFDRHVGFQPLWIRTDNQINFSLFREVSTTTAAAPIVLGKDDWLYEQGYISNSFGIDTAKPGQLEQFAADLGRLRDQLQRRGITLFVVLSPSKVTHCPEHLPDWAIRQQEVSRRMYPHRKADHEILAPLLAEADINCIDAVTWFHGLKQEQQQNSLPEYRLFTKGGVHWSLYGGHLVTIRLLDRLKELTGEDLTTLRCWKVSVDYETLSTDNDLGDVLNIWTPWVTKGPTAHCHIMGTPGQWQPDVLWVGSSFSYTLTDLLDLYHVYRQRDTLFMFGRRVSFPSGQAGPVHRANFDWERELLGRDLLIIEINEAQMSDPGFGFVERALEFFDAQETGQIQHD